MTVAIEQPGEFEADIKRFYMPGAHIALDCPQCGSRVEVDLGDDYLSGPLFNGITEIDLPECDECEYQPALEIRLNLTIEWLP